MNAICIVHFKITAACLSLALFWTSVAFGFYEESKIIQIRSARGSVDTVLEVIAINDTPVEPAEAVTAGIGDIVTFRVTIRNALSLTHYNVESEINWGSGFSFKELHPCEHVECVYEERSEEINAVIPELLPDATGETTYAYSFDLVAERSEDLFVNLYSDELYTCDTVKTFYMTFRLETPDIQYTVSRGNDQAVIVNIDNEGKGKAVGFHLETDLHNYPFAVENVSEGFTYDASTGTFRCISPIEPGETKTMTFDMALASPVDSIFFKAAYESVCGIQFVSPAYTADLKAESYPIPSPVKELGPSTEIDDSVKSPLHIRVSPECFRVSPPDRTLEWSIYLINSGEETLRSVKLRNTLGRSLRYEYSFVDDQPTSPVLTDETSPSGATSVLWDLGDIAPAGVRKITITACPPENFDELDGFFNSIVVQHGEAEFVEYEEIVASPCFFLPGECIDGDVFERCGKLHGFFAYSQMYRSNLFRTAKDRKSVWATFLTPGVWLAVPASCERVIEIVTTSSTPGGLAVSPFYPSIDRRYQTYLLYTSQYEIYHSHSDRNLTSHRVDAYFRYNTRNRFSFRVLDLYNRSSDSISSRAFTIDDRYRSNLLNAVATYDPTDKFRLRLDYSNFYLNYDGELNSRRADRMDNSWAAYGFFNITSKLAIFANYEFTDINYDINDLDSQEKRLYGGIRWDVTYKTSGQVKGGYGKREFEVPGISDMSTWMAEIQVDHVLTPRSRVIFNAHRRYDEVMTQRVDRESLPQGFTKAILTHFFGLSLNYDILSRLGLNLDGTMFFDHYQDEGRPAQYKERRDTEYSISPALKFDFRKWLTADLAYTYTKRDSNYPRFNYEDHTVFLRASLYY